jgi:DNA topoisomerase IB
MMSEILRVAARYQSKKELDSGNVVYNYTERQIADRHKKKAERYEKLRGSIEKLRKKVDKDLDSEDLKTKRTALAVALMDQTYERVGNDKSADDGHFGVTGWQKQHIKFSGGKATIKYVGKSGVKHEKIVTDKKVVSSLKEAYDELGDKEDCLFEADEGCVKAKDVNAYLKEFDITAKDLRGLHANEEMCERLKSIRSKGGKLPKDKKEREKALKEEFKKTLEEVADVVGHESATLRSQYLVPNLEDQYMVDGSVISKLNEKTADMCSPPPPKFFSDRLIRMIIDHMGVGEVIVEDDDFLIMRTMFRNLGGDWEVLYQGDPKQHKTLRDVVTAWAKSPGRTKTPETR